MPAREGHRVPVLVLRQKARDADFLAVIHPRQEKAPTMIPQVRFQRGPEEELRVTVVVGKREDHIKLGKTHVQYRKGQNKSVSVDFQSIK